MPQFHVERFLRKGRRSGGGLEGNVGPGEISILKRSLPFVKTEVTNRYHMWGGREVQTVEVAKQQVSAPARERERVRAVTAEDFEILAQQVPGVGRVQCLMEKDKPGQVTLMVVPELPRIDDDDNYIIGRDRLSNLKPPQQVEPVKLQLTVLDETKDRLLTAMQPRLLLGIYLNIIEADYDWMWVEVFISPDSAVKAVKRTLYRFFYPLTGGMHGNGWRLNEDLSEDMLWKLIAETPGVEAIDGFNMYNIKDGKENPLTAQHDRPIRHKSTSRIFTDLTHIIILFGLEVNFHSRKVGVKFRSKCGAR